MKKQVADRPLTRVVKLAHEKGLLRSRDLNPEHIARTYLRVACQRGVMERVGRGLYRLPGEGNAHSSLAEVCKRIPRGVICLTSALRFHELTTQLPRAVQVAIARQARAPKVDFVTVEPFRFSKEALAAGVEAHAIGAVSVRVYNAAKTVADCFKYRNKIGLSVAIEALRDGLRQRKVRIDDLVRYGRICRVERVMRPYIEAFTQ